MSDLPDGLNHALSGWILSSRVKVLYRPCSTLQHHGRRHAGASESSADSVYTLFRAASQSGRKLQHEGVVGLSLPLCRASVFKNEDSPRTHPYSCDKARSVGSHLEFSRQFVNMYCLNLLIVRA